MIKSFSEAIAVSGYEKPLRLTIENIIKDKNFDLRTDSIGNLFVSTKKNPDLPTVAIYAHMDEPGIIITDITDDGYLKFETIGKIETSSLISQYVKIGQTNGVISLKAVHLTSKEERKKPVKSSNLFIDIGASSKKDAEMNVSLGDYGSFDTSFSKITDNYIKGKALASRVPCSVLTDILLDSHKYNVNICAVFTVQKEISSRGAIVSSYNFPDSQLSILIDCEDATENDENKIKVDNGVAICRYKNIPSKSLDMLSFIEKNAIKNNILYQKSVIADNSEVYSLTSKKSHLSIIPLNIPCKFMYTAVNVVSQKDINSTKEIIKMLLKGEENV